MPANARIAMSLVVLTAGVLMPALTAASRSTLETSHLVVSDSAGNLSDERLRQLASHAQETLGKVLELWSADARIGQFGKIRVVFDAPRRNDYYTSVCIAPWDDRERRRVRTLRVFGSERPPVDMAHKLLTCVLPHQDKLIRNIMGVPTEERLGNRLAFPGCGFSSDDWVLALLRTNSLIHLNELGRDDASWGHPLGADGIPYVTDRLKQTKGYAEAGSFGNYLMLAHGIARIKRFYELSLKKDRPWRDAFGVGIQELEENWLKTLRARETAREKTVSMIVRLMAQDPDAACVMAQKLATANP